WHLVFPRRALVTARCILVWLGVKSLVRVIGLGNRSMRRCAMSGWCRGSLAIMVLALFVSVPGQSADWPGWRGSTGMGHTEEKNLPLNWNAKDGQNIVWKSPLLGTAGKAKLDHNQSSPIVWRDRVFLIMVYWPEGVAQTEFPEHHVACYSTKDGSQL